MAQGPINPTNSSQATTAGGVASLGGVVAADPAMRSRARAPHSASGWRAVSVGCAWLSVQLPCGAGTQWCRSSRWGPVMWVLGGRRSLTGSSSAAPCTGHRDLRGGASPIGGAPRTSRRRGDADGERKHSRAGDRKKIANI
jgi:hypothetical protein